MEGSKQNQLGKFAGGEPGEAAAIIFSSEGHAPVTLDAMPTQVGGLQPLARHGLHGIAEDRLYVSDFYEHASLA
jgi:hypothetical protein